VAGRPIQHRSENGPDRQPRAGQLCPAIDALGLGAAGFHRPARPVRLFLHPAPAAVPGIAGAAAAVRHHDPGCRRLFHASRPPRWCGAHDRQRRRGRVRAVRGVEGRGGVRAVRRPARDTRRLGTRGVRPYAGTGPAAAHGRWLRMSRPDSFKPASLAVTGLTWALAMAPAMTPLAAHAQFGAITRGSAGKPLSQSEPVTFTADQVEYDRANALVIAKGHVEAWQNDHVLRADEITFDRNTGVAAAKGHVVLLEPDGQVLFADYAEMTRNMQQAVLKDMRALLAENGRLAANGARRTDGVINEMTKVVYSACNLCKDDPTRPPLWEIRAADAVQDLEHKRIEYRDVTLDMFGVPVAYAPYFWHPDPSVKRQSGLLPPAVGLSSSLGAFYAQPYYWAIDGQSDATITPMMTTRLGPDLDAEYRRRFNSGYLLMNGSIGQSDRSVQGSFVTRGQFDLNDTWRWGFDINRTSSADYIRAYHVGTGLEG